jgi:hypothetical protein
MTEVEVLGLHADLLARAGSHRDAERKAERTDSPRD